MLGIFCGGSYGIANRDTLWKKTDHVISRDRFAFPQEALEKTISSKTVPKNILEINIDAEFDQEFNGDIGF